MSESMPDRMSGRVARSNVRWNAGLLEHMSNRMPERMPDRMSSRKMPDRMSVNVDDAVKNVSSSARKNVRLIVNQNAT